MVGTTKANTLKAGACPYTSYDNSSKRTRTVGETNVRTPSIFPSRISRRSNNASHRGFK